MVTRYGVYCNLNERLFDKLLYILSNKKPRLGEVFWIASSVID